MALAPIHDTSRGAERFELRTDVIGADTELPQPLEQRAANDARRHVLRFIGH